jgi:large subunit ribosomal protein L4
LPKQARKAALRAALAARLREGALVLVEEVRLPEAKTRRMVEFLKALGVERGLIVLAEGDEQVARAARNLPGVEVATADSVNVYQLLRHPKVVLALAAIEKLKKRVVQ